MMQTLTIRVDDSYINQILNFLQQIPKSKREILQHQKIVNKKDDFLKILERGPTLTKDELNSWEKNIKDGYKSWQIEEF